MNAVQIFWLAVGVGFLAAFLLGYGVYAELIAQNPRDSVAWIFVLGTLLAIVALVVGFIYWVLKVSGSG